MESLNQTCSVAPEQSVFQSGGHACSMFSFSGHSCIGAAITSVTSNATFLLLHVWPELKECGEQQLTRADFRIQLQASHVLLSGPITCCPLAPSQAVCWSTLATMHVPTRWAGSQKKE